MFTLPGDNRTMSSAAVSAMATPPALKFNLHSPAGDIFFFITPPTLVEKVFPPGHYALLGASYIAGALLQAL